MKGIAMMLTMLLIILLLFSSFIIAGCVEQKKVSEPAVSELSDEEILAQYPDDLDAALEELEMLDNN